MIESGDASNAYEFGTPSLMGRRRQPPVAERKLLRRDEL